MDDKVDGLYRKYLHDAIYLITNLQKQISEPRCYVSALLILRYLERISDHAFYVGDSYFLRLKRWKHMIFFSDNDNRPVLSLSIVVISITALYVPG
jgi:phosphate uptake regulator